MRHSKLKGSALVLVILTITALLVMTLGVSKLIVPYMVQNRQAMDAMVAQYTADSGKTIFHSSFRDQLTSIDTLETPQYFDLDTNTSVSTCNSSNNCLKFGYGQYKTGIYATAMVQVGSQPKVNCGLNKINNYYWGSNKIASRWMTIIDSYPSYGISAWPYDCSGESLDNLLNDPTLLNQVSLIYITNGTASLSSAGNSGVIDLRPYFKPLWTISPTDLGTYLINGGHILIDNASGAKIIFPSAAEINQAVSNGYYPSNTGLENIGFSWSAGQTDFYDPNQPSTYPVYVNESTDQLFNGEQTIFKYLYKYVDYKKNNGDPTMTINKALTLLQDDKLVDSSNNIINKFAYIDPAKSAGDSHPYKVGGGYTEMSSYSDPTHVNMAMQYFGRGPWGWVLVVSSSPLSLITAKAGESVDRINYTLCDSASCLGIPPAGAVPTDAEVDKMFPSLLFLKSVQDYARYMQVPKMVVVSDQERKSLLYTPYLDPSGVKQFHWE